MVTKLVSAITDLGVGHVIALSESLIEISCVSKLFDIRSGTLTDVTCKVSIFV